MTGPRTAPLKGGELRYRPYEPSSDEPAVVDECELRPGDEELDEIVLSKILFLHAEVMGDHEIWLGLETEHQRLHVWFYVTEAGTLRYKVTEIEEITAPAESE